MKYVMKTKKSIFSLLSVMLLLCSCEGLYSVKEVGEVNDDDMWTVPDMARGILFSSYDAMPSRPDTYSLNFLDVATDNAVTNSLDSDIYQVAMGDITAAFCPISVWDKCYEQFQNINLFLEKGLTDRTRYEADLDADAETKRQLHAEALYLRAWWGAYLLQFHGGRTADGQALGYPIVTSFISEEKASDYSWIRRDTYEDCVSQICADCDAAAEVLPAKATGLYVGRATSLMAEFLKARVLLYAASPAYQPESIVSIKGMGDYTVVDLKAYTDKWERAARQAWKVISLSGEKGYVPMKATDVVDMDANNPSGPSHFVFRYYWKSNNLESRHYPPYYFGSALTVPSQNLVDAYPMKANGYPINDPMSGYDPQSPYSGRDDRLDQTVYHQGSVFGQSGSSIDVVSGGKDSENWMNGSASGSRTGYYLAKFLSVKKNLLTPTNASTALHFYPSMRMAEMYFCLAEASNEAYGPTGKGEGIGLSAYEIMREVRRTAGGIENDEYIETRTGSRDDFRALILNERRLEFAFENFRFWDLRRCLMPLNETIRGISVSRTASGLGYEVKDVEERKLESLKSYWLPVPYDEVLKKPQGIVNNMGY